jgi:hypothetical protein
MKVFAFDPKTGRRGEHLRDVKRTCWTGSGYDYDHSRGLVESIDFVMPQQRPGVNHTVHMDAGGQADINGKFVEWSYLCDEWITFCSGKIGKRLPNGEIDGDWEWVILPPKSLIKRTQAWHDKVAEYKASQAAFFL